jgi:hypothetical protein
MFISFRPLAHPEAIQPELEEEPTPEPDMAIRSEPETHA